MDSPSVVGDNGHERITVDCSEGVNDHVRKLREKYAGFRTLPTERTQGRVKSGLPWVGVEGERILLYV